MSTLRHIHLSKETVYSRDMMMGGEEDHSDSEFVKTFAFRNCRHPYSAYPPDSSFRYAYLNPCQEKK
ncbi:MAG TPA: hypothetical protein VE264_07770 [Nitrososphaera sp.]|nr:hypothetical protein [Nitrososphaera sp.]